LKPTKTVALFEISTLWFSSCFFSSLSLRPLKKYTRFVAFWLKLRVNTHCFMLCFKTILASAAYFELRSAHMLFILRNKFNFFLTRNATWRQLKQCRPFWCFFNLLVYFMFVFFPSLETLKNTPNSAHALRTCSSCWETSSTFSLTRNAIWSQLKQWRSFKFELFGLLPLFGDLKKHTKFWPGFADMFFILRNKFNFFFAKECHLKPAKTVALF